jgi:hypothetical protein
MLSAASTKRCFLIDQSEFRMAGGSSFPDSEGKAFTPYLELVPGDGNDSDWSDANPCIT